MNIENCTHTDEQLSDCNTALRAIADTFYAIGGKWKLQIIIALVEKPRRFNELQRMLETITPRILSGELKELELNGFIRRKENDVLIQYELAEYSKTLREVIQSMINWGIAHRSKIKSDVKEGTSGTD